MLKTAFLSFIFMNAFFVNIPIFAADLKVVLRLDQIRDNQVVDRIELLSNQLQTNVRSQTDVFQIHRNGQALRVPTKLLHKLNGLRHDLGSDLRTGGVNNKISPRMCMMGGPAVGAILYSNYVKYTGAAFTVTQLGLKPVASQKGNCLFQPNYKAQKEQSRENATAVIAILETVSIFSEL